MINDSLFHKFRLQLQNLGAVVRISNDRIVMDPPDPLFMDHQNVFIKSYLVSACSILEAFIKEIAIEYINIIQSRISSANIPHNIIIWSISKDANIKDRSFKAFSISKRDEIGDEISANFYRTKKALELIGINIENNREINSYKDMISSIVDKRNDIVHRNDDASDLSMGDILIIIENIEKYAECIFNAIYDDAHIKPNF